MISLTFCWRTAGPTRLSILQHRGRKLLVGRLNYRLPLFSGWQQRILHLTTDKAYLSGFVECGNAFNEDRVNIKR